MNCNARTSCAVRLYLTPVLLLLLGLFACSDGGPTSVPDPDARDVAVVVNSVEQTLMIVGLEKPDSARITVGLGADGTPTGLSVRKELALVPMGIVATAQVVDLRNGVVARTIPLPSGSGATGSIFVNDSMALVANPQLGTVSPVNVRTGQVGAQIQVGGYPQAFAASSEVVVVVNAELENFVPARTATVSVLDRETLALLGTVELSGENSGAAVFGADGLLYVLNAGRWGEGSGSLSVVDPQQLREIAYHQGFGDFPGGLVLGGSGRLYASSWGFGVIAWDPGTGQFVRGPDSAITPDDVPSVAGLGVDGSGRVYTLFPDCQAPSRVMRLNTMYAVDAQFDVGICPSGIAFTEVGVD